MADFCFFSFLSLSQSLYERVADILTLCEEAVDAKKKGTNVIDLHPAVALAMRLPGQYSVLRLENGNASIVHVRELLTSAPSTEVPVDKLFDTFIELACRLMDGQLESGAFEEQVRELFSIRAYKVYTIDKLAQTIVRQMQLLIDEDSRDLVGAYLRKLREPNFNYRLHVMELVDDTKVLYKISQQPPKDRHIIHVQMIDLTEPEPATKLQTPTVGLQTVGSGESEEGGRKTTHECIFVSILCSRHGRSIPALTHLTT